MSITTESGVPAPLPRHALGLPAGSVRAMLALGVLGLLAVLAFMAPLRHIALPMSLVYLLLMLAVLILASFWSAHGNSIGERVSASSPLGLPKGSVRLLLMLGYGGLAAWFYLKRDEFAGLMGDVPVGQVFPLLGLLLGGFFLGHILSGIMRTLGGGTVPYWYQDLQAWVALIAMIALVVLGIVHVFINPNMPAESRITMPNMEGALAALVGLYFGARS
jgi:hypothetical protein